MPLLNIAAFAFWALTAMCVIYLCCHSASHTSSKKLSVNAELSVGFQSAQVQRWSSRQLWRLDGILLSPLVCCSFILFHLVAFSSYLLQFNLPYLFLGLLYSDMPRGSKSPGSRRPAVPWWEVGRHLHLFIRVLFIRVTTIRTYPPTPYLGNLKRSSRRWWLILISQSSDSVYKA